MSTPLIAALLTMKQRGLDDWMAAQYNGTADISVRPSRRTILLSRDFLQSADVELIMRAVWSCILTTEHPGYAATCGGCSKVYYRSKPAAAVHYCFSCGPVAGHLEFE